MKTRVDIKSLLMQELIEVNNRQSTLMERISKEKCDDIHSVLRIREYSNSIVELEVKKELLIGLLSKVN